MSEMTRCANCGAEVPVDKPHRVGECRSPLTLTEFLLARLADLETMARAVMADHLSTTGNRAIDTGDDPWPSERAFAEHLTPARVLAECEAKRQIVELHHLNPEFGAHGLHLCVDSMITPDECTTLRILALPYADHPDYDESWRP